MGKCQSVANITSSYSGGSYPPPSLKSTMDSYHSDSSSTNEDTSSPSVFSIFHEEDIILNILSYVADVPYEMNSNGMFMYVYFFAILKSSDMYVFLTLGT